MKIKKLFTILLFASLLVFTACNEPGDTFEKAEEKFHDVSGVISNFTSELKVSSGGIENKSTYKGTLLLNNETQITKISGTLTYNGTNNGNTNEPIKTEINSYYADGKYYSDIAGNKTVVDKSYEDSYEEFGLYGFPINLKKDNFKAISTSKEGEYEKISFLITSFGSKYFNGINTRFERFAQQSGEDGVFSLSEITGHVLLDGTRPVKLSMTIVGNIIHDDEATLITNKVENIFVYNGENEIDIPNINEYTAIGK